MNKERDLLVRAKVLLECVDTAPLQDQADLIIKEIQELLAQPEQDLREDYEKGYEAGQRSVYGEAVDTQPEVAEDDYNIGFKAGSYKANMIELRDHFACAAMQGFIALNTFKMGLIVTMSYETAVLMLAEREKNENI